MWETKKGGFDPWDGKNPMEEEMETLSSILVWRIPWTEEPGMLQTMGSQSQTQLSIRAHTHQERKHVKCFNPIMLEKTRESLGLQGDQISPT